MFLKYILTAVNTVLNSATGPRLIVAVRPVPCPRGEGKETESWGHHGFGYQHYEHLGKYLSPEGPHQFWGGGEEYKQHHPEARIKTITIHKEVKFPVRRPYPVKVEEKVPYPVKVPYEVKIEKPVPVHIDKPYPVYFDKKVPYAVVKEVPYSVKVEVKVPVPVPHTVHISKPYPLRVPVPKPYPVKVPVYIEKKIPVYIKIHEEHYEEPKQEVEYKHYEEPKHEEHHGFEGTNFGSFRHEDFSQGTSHHQYK